MFFWQGKVVVKYKSDDERSSISSYWYHWEARCCGPHIVHDTNCAIRDLREGEEGSNNEFCSISHLTDDTKKSTHELPCPFHIIYQIPKNKLCQSFLLQAVTVNGGKMFFLYLFVCLFTNSVHCFKKKTIVISWCTPNY